MLVFLGGTTVKSTIDPFSPMHIAAGVGSMITTILGYLKHASERRDFMLSFVPWYFARPLIGVLLGVVFYFVLKGGLLVTVGATDASSINVYGLGGLAALVGLFSKNAVEKLRDVFGTLFTTEADVQAKLLDRVPDDLSEQVKKALEGWRKKSQPEIYPACPARPVAPGDGTGVGRNCRTGVEFSPR